MPSKVYGILAAGKPFVAMMECEAEVARIAREFEVGFVVPPGDGRALARYDFTMHECAHASRRDGSIERERLLSRSMIVESSHEGLRIFSKRC